ncbi:MAG: hypothetical protein K0Q74_1492 [Gammaproteobacteria bacterium]|jgi:monoamine oxidase|nr:hypothetical protein [Gammaproteobacteria bacterium]
MKKDVKIAVIGAGLAGLAAAYRLMQYGLEVDVFEAKNRAGGRVFTVLMENYLGDIAEVELGAQNITDGGESAYLLNLAKELNLNIQQKIIDTNHLVYSGSDKADYAQLLANHHSTAADIKKLVDKANNIGQLIELFCEDNRLLQQALFSRMMAYEGLNPYEQSIYHNIETFECAISGGVAKVHEFYEHKHDQVVTSFIKGGNARLPMEIAKRLEGKIHYNKALSKIAINGSCTILTFVDQSVYEYDHVILAIPVATFNNIDFSEAKIEKNQLRKIESIGYGSNYKIALPLDLKQKNNISSIIKDNMLSFYNNDETIQLLYVNDKVQNVQDFINVLSPSNNHSMGPIMQVADQNYKIYKQNICCDWKKDRYFKGSYAGYSVSISEELDKIEYHLETPYKALFTPISNMLFFAGEHTTILECIGTMEAAVESGERMAKAIIKLTAN